MHEMDFAPSARAAELAMQVEQFLAAEIEPIEAEYHAEI